MKENIHKFIFVKRLLLFFLFFKIKLNDFKLINL